MEAKKWLEEHKGRLVIGGIAIGSFVLGYHVCKSCSKPKTIAKLAEEMHLEEVPVQKIPGDAAKAINKIDEQVFTDFAPWLENAILAEGIDEDLLMDQLTVPFPKGGDWKNGTYEVVKDILILVRDAGDPIKDTVERMQELVKAGAENG